MYYKVGIEKHPLFDTEMVTIHPCKDNSTLPNFAKLLKTSSNSSNSDNNNNNNNNNTDVRNVIF